MWGLPRDSTTFLELFPEETRWGLLEELTATLAELVHESNRLFVMAHSKRGTRIPDPLEIPRPGRARAAGGAASEDEIRRFFGKGS